MAVLTSNLLVYDLTSLALLRLSVLGFFTMGLDLDTYLHIKWHDTTRDQDRDSMNLQSPFEIQYHGHILYDKAKRSLWPFVPIQTDHSRQTDH